MGERHNTNAMARRQTDGEYQGALEDDDDRADLKDPLPRTYVRAERPAGADPMDGLIGGLAHQAEVADLYADTRG